MQLEATKQSRTGLANRAIALGLNCVEATIQLAAQRGCEHYRIHEGSTILVSESQFSNEELVGWLLHFSENLQAIRCCGQLLRKSGLNLDQIVCDCEELRVTPWLRAIAKLGRENDLDATEFWDSLWRKTVRHTAIAEEKLPHWSRFMSQSGYVRGCVGIQSAWLTPCA